MGFKILSGLVAAAMLIVFIGPVVIKLQDVALSVVVLIGVVMMIVDMLQALKSNED